MGGPQVAMERPADAVRALVLVCDGGPHLLAGRHHADGPFVRLKPKTSLHGDARFANDRELRQFEYQGEYKNTSKASK
nr:hypothetical protein pPsy0479a_00021 [Pseudomonas syringae]